MHLIQAGLPISQWRIAADVWTDIRNGVKGTSRRLSTAALLPFGTFGQGVLPDAYSNRSKLCPKLSPVIYLGPARNTSGGVRIIYSDRHGFLRVGVVMEWDVKWEPCRCGLEIRTKELQRILNALHDGLAPPHPVAQWQAEC